MDALRCPPADEPVTTIRWRASPGGATTAETAVVQTRPVVARQADQPPRRGSVRWLEDSIWPATPVRSWRSPGRYFLDNVAEWILGSIVAAPTYEGNYSTYLEKKPSGSRCKTKLQKRLTELAWVQSGGQRARPKAGTPAAPEEMAAEAEKTRKLDFERFRSRSSPAQTTWWLRSTPQ